MCFDYTFAGTMYTLKLITSLLSYELFLRSDKQDLTTRWNLQVKKLLIQTCARSY